MKPTLVSTSVFAALFMVIGEPTLLPPQIQAQPIPATDGTGTRVVPQGNRFDVDGGKLSKDGANLFHSFQRFGLNREQVVNFLSNPEIRNILARVVGGDASYINGLIQVTGGNSNLFLVNPSGIVFGSNARLNLAGDFTATTANAIGFGSGWFNASGSNDYASLVGAPNAFAFTMNQPGGILNAGDLSVGKGRDLNLIAGEIISTGTLAAPEGNLIVTTAPGGSLVRISQAGSVLQLEVEPLVTSKDGINSWSIPILSLPELLAGGGSSDAQDLERKANSQAQLAINNLQLSSGDIVVRDTNSKNSILSAAHNLFLLESQLRTAQDLTLQAQNNVIVRDSPSRSFTAQAQGNIRVQGNQGIDILALNHSDHKSFQSGGNLSLVSDGIVSGDAHFTVGGSFSVLNLSGKPGNFTSLHDPIISSIGDVLFGNYIGTALKVETLGSINAGNIRITGPDAFLTGTDPDIPILTSSPALILRAGLSVLNNPTNVPLALSGITFTSSQQSSGSISVGNIDTSSGFSNGGSIILNAKNNILTGDINSSAVTGNGGNISIVSSLGIINTGSILSLSESGNGGAVALNALQDISIGNIRSNSGNGSGARFFITTRESLVTNRVNRSNFIQRNFAPGDTVISETSKVENVSTSPNINPPSSGFSSFNSPRTASPEFVRGRVLFTSGRGDGKENGNGGEISITSNSGKVFTGDLYSFSNSFSGSGGNVRLNASTDIQAGSINTSALGSGNGGGVSILSNSGSIRSSNISSASSFYELSDTPFRPLGIGSGGSILISAPNGTIEARDINSVGFDGAGGEININALHNIKVGDVGSGSVGNTGYRGGDISINSLLGNIKADILFTESENNSGRVNLTAGNSININRIFVGRGSGLFLQARQIAVEEVAKGFFDLELKGISVSVIIPNLSATAVSQPSIDRSVIPDKTQALERQRQEEFEQYFGLGKDFSKSFVDSKYISRTLGEINEQTETESVVIYAYLENNQLRLRAVTAKSKDIENESRVIEDNQKTLQVQVSKEELMAEVSRFNQEIQNPRSKEYLKSSIKLYKWLIKPLESFIPENATLLFSMDNGLRLIPLAALYDEEKGQFLVEKYNFSIIPNFKSTDVRYTNLMRANILAMGASKFEKNDEKGKFNAELSNLPSVPVELSTIIKYFPSSQSFLNSDFTLENLIVKRHQYPFQIIHLATHASFSPGDPGNSSIQLWNSELHLNQAQLQLLGWNSPPLDLLVLSACRTAFGSRDAELGFSGLSLQSGAKSVIASLWYVSDPSTLVLMKEFYERLSKDGSVKSKALQSAQLALLAKDAKDRRKVLNDLNEIQKDIEKRLSEEKYLTQSDEERQQLDELNRLLKKNPQQVADKLSHPFYWSAFTLVGSPW